MYVTYKSCQLSSWVLSGSMAAIAMIVLVIPNVKIYKLVQGGLCVYM